MNAEKKINFEYSCVAFITVMMQYLPFVFHLLDFPCVDVFVSLKMHLIFIMTLQTASSSNLKRFGSERRKEN